MSNEKKKKEFWEYFYKEGENIKPDNRESFLKNLNDDVQKKHLLTSGMESVVKSKIASEISKSQMRNLFDEVKKCNESNVSKTQIRLIYTAGRINSDAAKDFISFIIDILKIDIELGKEYMESALAYHKYHGKKQ
jgi:CRISPR/Cas system CSM-associated protein Csm2 small subunit